MNILEHILRLEDEYWEPFEDKYYRLDQLEPILSIKSEDLQTFGASVAMSELAVVYSPEHACYYSIEHIVQCDDSGCLGLGAAGHATIVYYKRRY